MQKGLNAPFFVIFQPLESTAIAAPQLIHTPSYFDACEGWKQPTVIRANFKTLPDTATFLARWGQGQQPWQARTRA